MSGGHQIRDRPKRLLRGEFDHYLRLSIGFYPEAEGPMTDNKLKIGNLACCQFPFQPTEQWVSRQSIENNKV